MNPAQLVQHYLFHQLIGLGYKAVLLHQDRIRVDHVGDEFSLITIANYRGVIYSLDAEHWRINCSWPVIEPISVQLEDPNCFQKIIDRINKTAECYRHERKIKLDQARAAAV